MSKPVEVWTKKWQKRTAVARDDYEYGVANPRRGPASAAIAARSDLETKMAQKSTWDKWQDSLAYVGDQGVIDAAVAKGPERYIQGVKLGADNQAKFAVEFKAHLDKELPAIRKMSKATIDQAKAKAGAMIEAAHKFRFKKK